MSQIPAASSSLNSNFCLLNSARPLCSVLQAAKCFQAEIQGNAGSYLACSLRELPAVPKSEHCWVDYGGRRANLIQITLSSAPKFCGFYITSSSTYRSYQGFQSNCYFLITTSNQHAVFNILGNHLFCGMERWPKSCGLSYDGVKRANVALNSERTLSIYCWPFKLKAKSFCWSLLTS